MNYQPILHLGQNQNGRRAGLRRVDYQTTHLLEKVNGQSLNQLENMPSGPATCSRMTKIALPEKRPPPEEDEEDINRPPQDSSDDDDYQAAQISTTTFTKGPEKPIEEPKKPISSRSRRTLGGDPKGKVSLPRNSSRGGSPPLSSSNPRPGPKGKSQDGPLSSLGAGMTNDLGFLKSNNKPRKRRKVPTSRPVIRPPGGKSRSNPNISSQASMEEESELELETPPKKASLRSKLDTPLSQSPDLEPLAKFRMPSEEADSPMSTASPLKRFKPVPDDLDSPMSTQSPLKPYMAPPDVDSPMSTDSPPEKWKNVPAQSPFEDDNEPHLAFRSIKMDEDTPIKTFKHPPGSSEKEGTSIDESPLTQPQVFKKFDFDDEEDLISTARNMLSQHNTLPPTTNQNPANDSDDEDSFMTNTQRSLCPMCDAPVDPTHLLSFGKHMNIRAQERFCRSHKIRTAKQTWEESGYPTINWGALDCRITSHHPFIKTLINGSDSHFRRLLTSKVDQGKDRNLLNMTSNLTPGYYGNRGLRIISENIMGRFTKLLKKRMVDDRVMSARGFTPFVQMVLVPEVVTRLIMEDLDVGEERAREVLGESVEVGELLCEEVEEVVEVREESGSESEVGSEDGYED